MNAFPARRFCIATVGLLFVAASPARAQNTSSNNVTALPARSGPGFGGNHAATEQDHRRMMDLLHITSIRQGRDGMNPQSPNYANYD